MKKILLTASFTLMAMGAFSQNWNTVFTSSGTGEKLQLVEGKKGEVFLGFRDFQKGKANVKKYLNGSWSWVGDSVFSNDIIADLKLAIAGDSMPVVAFQDTKKDWQLTVMKFNGTKWDTLGRRGFSGFTGSGDVNIACSNDKIFAAFQQYNQIKVWSWNSTNSTWEVVGTNGIASVGFPTGCELKVIGDKLYIGYRTNPGANEVRFTDATTASSSSIWSTLRGTFGSGMTGAIRLTNILNSPMASNLRSSDKFMSSYLHGAGNWNSAGGSPQAISTYDISDGGTDTFPLLAYIDANNKGRVYKGNKFLKWDSIGNSSYFTTDVIKGSPEVLWTSNRHLLVAYENNTDWKIIVKEYCAKVSGINVKIGGNDSFCQGSNVSITASIPGASVRWYRNNVLQANETSGSLKVTNSGAYKAVLKNACGDSFTTAEVTMTAVPSPAPTIVQNGATLSTQTFLGYQWKLDGNDIGSANGPTFTPVAGGVYTVSAVNASGCIGISAPFTFWPASTNNTNTEKLEVYPNPMNDELFIHAPNKLDYIITNIAGKVVYTNNTFAIDRISTIHWPAGLYFLKTANGTTLKIVKQ